jgi:outer membrane protein TolC
MLAVLLAVVNQAVAKPSVADDAAQCPATGGELRIEQALRLSALRPARVGRVAQLLADLAQLDVAADKPYVPRVSVYAQGSKTQASGAPEWDSGAGQWLTTTNNGLAGVKSIWQGPLGTRLELDVANSRQRVQTDTLAVTGGPQTTLTLSQPLLRGAGARVATAAQRQAQRARQIAYLQYVLSLEDDSMAVVNGYLQALSAQQRLVVAEHALKAAHDINTAIAHYVTAGVRPTAHARQAQLSVSQSEANLNSARAQSQTAILNLAALVGCPVGREWKLNLPRLAPAPPGDVQPLPNSDQTLPELVIRRLALDDAELALDVATNATKPDVSILASYSRAKNVGIGVSSNWSVGLSLNLPLNDYEARANVTAARQRILQAQSALEQARERAAIQFRSATLAVDNARRQQQLAREQLRFAAQVLDDEDAMLRAGRSTLLEWQTALSTRSTSQVALEQAEADLYVAHLELWRAEGSLLRALGVDAQVPIPSSDAL